MKTHYLKKEGPKGALIPGILPSCLYSKMDGATLYTYDGLFSLAIDVVAKESIRMKCGHKEVENCIGALVADGWLTEIFGAKLDKFISTYK